MLRDTGPNASAVQRHNVQILGQGPRAMVLAHGFGCDQTVWQAVLPELSQHTCAVIFDHAGAGDADPALYDPARHADLDGYARDMVTLLADMGVGPVDFVGHSVSAMIGARAAILRPDLFASLVMLTPSACYLNLPGYRGGFDAKDISELLELLEANYAAWAEIFAPLATGNPDRPELAEDFVETLCRTDPVIAANFARATFFADCRADLPRVQVPTLVLECTEDPIAPPEAVRFVHETLPDSRHVLLQAQGHCPHLSHPDEVARVLADVALRRIVPGAGATDRAPDAAPAAPPREI